MTSLFDDVRATENLFSAWRHVRRSAMTSKDGKVKGEASEFEHQHQRHLKRIQTQLRQGHFKFDGFKGVLKDRKARLAKGKAPRPIAIGSIKNRVVQRAILQVLQPRKILSTSDPNSKFTPKKDPRLKSLNDVNCSRFGVGGLMSPYGGVQPAIRLIMQTMREGASYFYQSDIKAFFTKIPTQIVVDKVAAETEDDRLVDLFAEALKVNLANKDDLLSYAKLFPSQGEGVAQGSSLSAFAGNVLLYDFDHQLNQMGVSAVRYIDDIIILSELESSLEAAIHFSKSYLKRMNLDLYEPVKGSDKASSGLCKSGFHFLGCTIQPARCVPSANSRRKIRDEIQMLLSESKKEIAAFVKSGNHFNLHLSQSAVIEKIGKKLYGWEKSFAFCTDGQAFKVLDNEISHLVCNFEQEIKRLLINADKSSKLQVLGIPSTNQLFITDQAKIKKLSE